MQNKKHLEDITIYNFLPIADNLYTAGQPRAEELSQLQRLQVATVINLGLCDTEYALDDEAGAVQALGMQYVHIPVEWELPRKEDLVRFLNVMQDKQDQVVFVHCAANKRVSIFVAIYRIRCLGLLRSAVDPAIAEIWSPNTVWLSFLNEMLLDKQLLQEISG